VDHVQESAGRELRSRVEQLGTDLAQSLTALVADVPRRPSGPQALGRALNMTTVTASRLLKALGQPNPISVLQLLPGPNPLRKMVDTAEEIGTPPSVCETARGHVTAFDELIRDEAGDRGSLRAMLSAWLPDDRREFEGQRRQTIFKALSELEGVACEFELTTILFAPSESAGKVNLVSLKCLLGIDRIRPDAPVKLGTRRLSTNDEAYAERVPLNLDGAPALNGLDAVRLDGFCNAPPAPLVARQYGHHVEYALGPTGFGRNSKVDLVIGELTRDEPMTRSPSSTRPPYFFTVPEMPTRNVVFDLVVHKDLFDDGTPSLLYYDTSSNGPAIAADPARELDLRYCPEPLQKLGRGIQASRLLEFPRYVSLLEHVGEKLAWTLSDFDVYRVQMSYPMVGRQITLAFMGDSES
jgi:hypothetical protein